MVEPGPGYILNQMYSGRGRVSKEQLQNALAEYFRVNPPPPGKDGQPGRAPTPAEINAAVDAYMAAHPVPAGAKGDTGATGPQGTKGDTGAVGLTGPQGLTGTKGDQGPAGTPATTLVGSVTLTEPAFINLNLSVRKVTVALTGTVPSGSYIAVPVSATPVGYSIQEAVCSTAGQITVSILVPVIQLLSTYSIPVRVFRINT